MRVQRKTYKIIILGFFAAQLWERQPPNRSLPSWAYRFTLDIWGLFRRPASVI